MHRKMICKYCGSEMDLMEHYMDGDVEIHSYSCMNDKCNAICTIREDSDEKWEGDGE